MFCADCGTESKGGKFCTNCGALLADQLVESLDHMEAVLEDGDETTLGHETTLENFLDELESVDYDDDLSFMVQGIVNIEGGDISFRTSLYDKSSGEYISPIHSGDCCNEVEEGVPFFVRCKVCNRSDKNYFWIPAGDGDGLYTVFTIAAQNKTIGLAVVLAPTAEFTQPLFNQTYEAQNPFVSISCFYPWQDLEAFEVCTLEVPKEGELYITDKYTGIDSGNSVIRVPFSNSEATKIRFFSFSEFTEKMPLSDEQKKLIETLREEIDPNLANNLEIPDVEIKPRVIMGLTEEWLNDTSFDFVPSVIRPDGPGFFYDWTFFGEGNHHINTMGGVAAYFNALLWIKIPGLAVSWLLLGAAQGDEDCQKLLRDPSFSEILSDVKMIAVCFRIQHQFGLADEIESSGKLPSWLKTSKFKINLKDRFKS